jgi:tRNA threonylcarbamoyl adenosine modification protein YeaZ
MSASSPDAVAVTEAAAMANPAAVAASPVASPRLDGEGGVASEVPPGLLLALHSSTDTLGLALQGPYPLGQEPPTPQLAAFPLGRALANQLLACVEELLPASQWPQLTRLAVAIGPGGFTGTRLTVVLARTLAQQLGLPLDGVSSFQLIARRLLAAGPAPADQPFWLVQELPRRGLVAGHYRADPRVPGGLAELSAPRLYGADQAFAGCSLAAVPLVPEDVAELVAISRAREAAAVAAPWQAVLPIYPTSPVQGG